ncbi:MAG: DNA polymerase III subunit delta' [Methylobacteriaceae bacterium]|jgi:DNA polymerase-3 subunit delta'|nr:DNA polymerase III subunit delta' [Methylobacteriaceae bacterium]
MAAERDTAGFETDRYPDTPHPREQLRLFGHGEAEKAFLTAVQSNKLHHAWLISGIEGIGKATFAYRIARFMVHDSPRALSRATSLDVAAGTGAAAQLAAGAHPNVRVLKRGLKERIPPKPGGNPEVDYSADIRVPDVRNVVASLFGHASEGGRYRVCIVDVADDLNQSSANALLKTLEEPPAHSLFLVLSHAPQLLLPTIRSRCRHMALSPLPDDAVRAVIPTLGAKWRTVDPARLDDAVAAGGGSVRRVLNVLSGNNLALIQTIGAILSGLPGTDDSAVLQLAETLTKKGADIQVSLFVDCVQRWAQKMIHDVVSAAPGAAGADYAGGLAQLAEVVSGIDADINRARAYNLMDLRPMILKLVGELADAVRRVRSRA